MSRKLESHHVGSVGGDMDLGIEEMFGDIPQDQQKCA